MIHKNKTDFPTSAKIYGLSPEWLREQVTKHRTAKLNLLSSRLLSKTQTKVLRLLAFSNWRNYKEAWTYIWRTEGISVGKQEASLRSIKRKYKEALLLIFEVMGYCNISPFVSEIILGKYEHWAHRGIPFTREEEGEKIGGMMLEA